MRAPLTEAVAGKAPSMPTGRRRHPGPKPVPALAACLLLGLLAWRHLVPGASPWLDIAAIAAGWAFLAAAKTYFARRD